MVVRVQEWLLCGRINETQNLDEMKRTMDQLNV